MKRLTILHSNDLHGDFLAEKIDEKLIGGVSYAIGGTSIRFEAKNRIQFTVLQAIPSTITLITGLLNRGSIIMMLRNKSIPMKKRYRHKV